MNDVRTIKEAAWRAYCMAPAHRDMGRSKVDAAVDAALASASLGTCEVTDEMVRRAMQAYSDEIYNFERDAMRAALTAALQQQEGKSHG